MSERTKELLRVFLDLFPYMENEIRIYGPFDREALKIETKDKKFYVFTYRNNKDWGLQTYKNYIESRRVNPKV